MSTQTKKSKQNFTTMIIIWAMIILFTGGMYVNAYLAGNHSETAYEEGDPPASATSMAAASLNLSIKNLVTHGAGQLMKAISRIGTISEKYELQDINGVDITTLLAEVNESIDLMSSANSYYSQLETKANNTPYNQDVIEKIETFNYRGFRIEKRLNKQIMNDVEDYLSCGDVRGVYSRFASDSNKIIQTLHVIKTSLESGSLPDNESMWNLNQDVSVMHLFGQYVARVFYEIK